MGFTEMDSIKSGLPDCNINLKGLPLGSEVRTRIGGTYVLKTIRTYGGVTLYDFYNKDVPQENHTYYESGRLFATVTSWLDIEEIISRGEEQMEQAQPQQNIIEAHGTQWEVTHSVSTEDLVNSPNHYAFFESDTGDTEAIEIIASSMTHEEFKGYCKGNALKYRLRLGKKDSIEQDLAKANKYQELYHLHKQRTLDWVLLTNNSDDLPL